MPNSLAETTGTRVEDPALESLLTKSDAMVTEKATELNDQRERRWVQYYRDVREALTMLDSKTDWGDWSDEEIRGYLKEDRRFSYSLERILDERYQSSHNATEDFVYMEDDYRKELCDVLAGVVADGFKQGMAIPLGYYIDRYCLDDRELLADLAERAYAMQDIADQDARNRDTAKRIFSALMQEDVSAIGRDLVGRDGREHLRERHHLGGYQFYGRITPHGPIV